MKIAALQMVSTPSVERNLASARRLIAQAARDGAQLVALPEYFCFMGANERDKPDPKEPESNQEESRTIGINDHTGEAMSENNLLKDMGAGYQRTDHDMSVTTK